MNTVLSLAIAVGCLGLLSACTNAPTYQKIDGQTMGTSYHITLEVPKDTNIADIQHSVERRLNDIIISMSTYQDDSTISKFNRLKAGQTITIDSDFIKVLNDSRLVYHRSHHAFDPTVYPLVELWGFGSTISVERLQNPPSTEQINAIQDSIGFEKVIHNGNTISKTHDGVGLDFSAIAKGYGVDVIAKLLADTYHIDNYMVEIGGEVATLGVNDKGNPWTLAIDAPIANATTANRKPITTITQPANQPLHIATSGGYRNFVEFDGVRYSHTINPNTLHPVADSTPSVTVIHDSVMLADGWATALTALPHKQALALANEQHIKALFVVEHTANTFEVIKTQAYLESFAN